MLKRILTALWGVPLILWIVHLGDQVFFILIEAIACFGLFEFYNLLEKRGYRPLNLEGIALGFLYLVALYLEGAWAYKFLLPILILTIFIYELVNKKRSIVDISLTFLGFFYIPFLIGYILLIRKLQFGEIFTYYVLILTWISDSCAFFIGKLLGKHKLAPSISPNKTVEGTLAAVFSALIFSLILGNIYHQRHIVSIILGLSLGIIGQLGDLVESMLKREIGVKDSSSLLPGHGGILDRFDSLLFMVPTAYYLLSMFQII